MLKIFRKVIRNKGKMRSIYELYFLLLGIYKSVLKFMRYILIFDGIFFLVFVKIFLWFKIKIY